MINKYAEIVSPTWAPYNSLITNALQITIFCDFPLYPDPPTDWNNFCATTKLRYICYMISWWENYNFARSAALFQRMQYGNISKRADSIRFSLKTGLRIKQILKAKGEWRHTWLFLINCTCKGSLTNTRTRRENFSPFCICIFVQGRWQPTQSHLIQIYSVDWADVYDTHNIEHRTEPVCH